MSPGINRPLLSRDDIATGNRDGCAVRQQEVPHFAAINQEAATRNNSGPSGHHSRKSPYQVRKR